MSVVYFSNLFEFLGPVIIHNFFFDVKFTVKQNENVSLKKSCCVLVVVKTVENNSLWVCWVWTFSKQCVTIDSDFDEVVLIPSLR